MTSDRAHWESTYAAKQPDRVSWYEPVPRRSLELIDEACLDRAAGIIDVGGGASSLASELLRMGFTDITVADISLSALDCAKAALGRDAIGVNWVQADVRNHDFGRTFDLWHDRATFHFMVEDDDRAGYLATLRRALAPGGHALIATFGPQGPTTCSGLAVQRYDTATLTEAIGGDFALISSDVQVHRTPSGASQQFLYARLQRSA